MFFPAVYKWQRGESMPTLDNIVELASVLEVDLEDLVQTKEMDDVARFSIILGVYCFTPQGGLS